MSFQLYIVLYVTFKTKIYFLLLLLRHKTTGQAELKYRLISDQDLFFKILTQFLFFTYCVQNSSQPSFLLSRFTNLLLLVCCLIIFFKMFYLLYLSVKML